MMESSIKKNKKLKKKQLEKIISLYKEEEQTTTKNEIEITIANALRNLENGNNIIQMEIAEVTLMLFVAPLLDENDFKSWQTTIEKIIAREQNEKIRHIIKQFPCSHIDLSKRLTIVHKFKLDHKLINEDSVFIKPINPEFIENARIKFMKYHLK